MSGERFNKVTARKWTEDLGFHLRNCMNVIAKLYPARFGQLHLFKRLI
jgi:hypothetical protein